MFESPTLEDERDYIDLLIEDDPYGPEFAPIDEDEYEYVRG